MSADHRRRSLNRKSMTKRKRYAFVAGALLLVGMLAIPVVRHARREAVRGTFSGCNALNANLAQINLAKAQMELEMLQANTNARPEELALLEATVTSNKVEVAKWEAHIRKYGHFHGNQTSQKR